MAVSKDRQRYWAKLGAKVHLADERVLQALELVTSAGRCPVLPHAPQGELEDVDRPGSVEPRLEGQREIRRGGQVPGRGDLENGRAT